MGSLDATGSTLSKLGELYTRNETPFSMPLICWVAFFLSEFQLLEPQIGQVAFHRSWWLCEGCFFTLKCNYVAPWGSLVILEWTLNDQGETCWKFPCTDFKSYTAASSQGTLGRTCDVVEITLHPTPHSSGQSYRNHRRVLYTSQRWDGPYSFWVHGFLHRYRAHLTRESVFNICINSIIDSICYMSNCSEYL